MQFMRDNADARAFGLRVREECNGTSMLQHYGKALLNEFQPAHAQTRDWVGNTMLDTAKDYYRLVWSGLTASERLTLFQLALYGL